MNREPNEIDQALSRTVRSSLEKFQRNAEELHHAVNDLVAACSSARVANTLPPMMRAQILAASLSASLEALSRFVTFNLPSALLADSASTLAASEAAFQPAPETAAPAGAQLAPPSDPGQSAPEAPEAAPEIWQTAPETGRETVASSQASELLLAQDPSPAGAYAEPAGLADFPEFPVDTPVLDSPEEEVPPGRLGGFDIAGLPAEEQELHRRANRVAKVSMQDIKLLRPEDVRLGQEHRDLCYRLREDLERAHKEYDRRFQTILGHPVDYFYDRLVEILANGDAQLLGEYPYPSAVLRH